MGNWAYEYDKRGNLIGISDRGKRVRAYDYDITGRLGLSYSKSGKARSYSYDGLGNRIGFKEYEEDTYGTQGHVQPFGYTGYRYDNVADTYFAQAREYVAGVGRFGGEDWIKGEISYPTSLKSVWVLFWESVWIGGL